MKNIFLLALLITSGNLIAQNSISLKKGQKINVVNVNNSEVDLGMGMQMINKIEMTSQLNIISEAAKEYKLTTTLLKAIGSMDLMGQKKDFNSDSLKNDTSEDAKSMAETFNKPINVTVNKYNAAVEMDKKDIVKEEDPMKDMMSAFGNEAEDAAVADAFLLVPAGKKAGESWVQTDSTKEGKVTKKYTINSIHKNTVVVFVKSVSEINNVMEIQGNSLDVMMSIKSSGEIISDIKTGLVKKRTIDSDITGTIGVMGQSMPISGKRSLISTFTIE